MMKIRLLESINGLPVGHEFKASEINARRLISEGKAEPVIEHIETIKNGGIEFKISGEKILSTLEKVEPSSRGRKTKIDPDSENLQNK